MTSVITKQRCLHYAALTLAAMMAATSANAAGTLSGTAVDNTATVDYEVAGITQAVIESSPAGNSNSGLGNGMPTSFLVDNVVDLSVVEIGGLPMPTTPGAPLAVTTFRVTNEGNTTQDYALLASNLTSADPSVHGNADTDVDMSLLQVFVDINDNDTYDDGVDVGTFIDGLLPDDDIEVFVVATAPLGALTTDFANVRLEATTFDDGSDATGTATAQTVGADTALVDVVFADGAGLPADVPDGIEWADDGYTFSTADLTISKTSTVNEDPFNGTTDPKAIPGAFVQYDIVISNTGTVVADAVVIADTLPAEVRRAPGRMTGSSDILIVPSVGASSTCTFDPTGDSDGCNLTGIGAAPGLEGGDLDIDTGLTIAAGTSVTISFQVEIL